MAHFAKLNENNVVTGVYPGDDSQDELELSARTGKVYKRTSYNTRAGVHAFGGTPFRGNYAGIGYTYDEALDAFLPPKLSDDATLDETTFTWVVPEVVTDETSEPVA